MQKLIFLSAAIFLIACNNNAGKNEPDRDTASTVEQVPRKPAIADTIFTGLGTEPFWAIYVVAEKQIVFHPADGPEIEVPFVAGATIHDATVYESRQGTNAIRLTIIKKDCSDGMSETVHPYQVTLVVNNKNYAGCGRLEK